MADDERPRDEHGRFTSDGGGGSKSAKERHSEVWANAQLGGVGRQNAGGGARARESFKAWANAQLGAKEAVKTKGGETTQKRDWVGTVHEDGSFSGQLVGKGQTIEEHFKDGKPTAERAKMHEEEFIKPALEGKKTAAELGQKKPLAIMTMGGPASGKGTVLNKLGEDKDKFVHVDPDEVKGKLPEYVKQVPNHKEGTGGMHGDGTGPTFRGAAAQVHEESSYVADRIADAAIAGGHNVIIDGTGGNADKFLSKIDKLQKAGYDVRVHYPHLDKEEGVKRAESRAEGSGRYVPTSFIKNTYDKIESNRDKIMSKVDNLTVYDGENKHAVAFRKKDGVAPLHGLSPMQAVAHARKAIDKGVKIKEKKS